MLGSFRWHECERSNNSYGRMAYYLQAMRSERKKNEICIHVGRQCPRYDKTHDTIAEIHQPNRSARAHTHTHPPPYPHFIGHLHSQYKSGSHRIPSAVAMRLGVHGHGPQKSIVWLLGSDFSPLLYFPIRTLIGLLMPPEFGLTCI